jgi:hypothetical protein
VEHLSISPGRYKRLRLCQDNEATASQRPIRLGIGIAYSGYNADQHLVATTKEHGDACMSPACVCDWARPNVLTALSAPYCHVNKGHLPCT